jgi:hypothetical protein
MTRVPFAELAARVGGDLIEGIRAGEASTGDAIRITAARVVLPCELTFDGRRFFASTPPVRRAARLTIRWSNDDAGITQ